MGAIARFRQSDLTKAVKAVKDAGVTVGRIEVDAHGKIVIFPTGAPEAKARDTSWDDV